MPALAGAGPEDTPPPATDPRLAPELAALATAGRFPFTAIVEFEANDLALLRGRLAPALRDETLIRQRLAELREQVRQAREGLGARLLRRTGTRARLAQSYQHIPQAVVEITDADALEGLLEDPAVRAVMPDHRLTTDDLEALPLIGQPATVASGVRGDGTAVAVIDTGVQFSHSDFGGCTAPGVPATCRVAVSIDIAPNDGQPDNPANPHGTNVSAIVANTAPGARLVVLDVFDTTGASSSTIIAAYDWVIANRAAHNIRAVNLSLSVPGIYSASDCGSSFTGFAADGRTLPNQSNPFVSSIDTAAAVGIATLSSAGNDGIKTGLPMPACSLNAISVGAVYDSAQGSRSWAAGCTDSVTAADLVGCFSNSAGILELLAPGITITAGGLSYSGTSQAAPHVAGAWALLAAAFPDESVTQLRTRLVNGGRPVLDALAGLTRPRLDLRGVFPPPANDAFASASTLSGHPISLTTNNRFASREPGEPLHAGGNGGLSLWWRWTAPADGRATVDLAGSGIDTLLGVYTGTALGSLVTVASNDDAAPGVPTSRVNFPVTGGTPYLLAVDGKAGAWGPVSLALGWQAPAADLSAELAVSPDPVLVGGTLEYRLGTRNKGPDTARSVNAILTLPTGVTAGPAPAGCTTGTGTVTCTRDTLASGDLAEWTLPATVSAAGSLGASLSVSSATADPVAGNDTQGRSVQALLPADLSVQASAVAASVPEGGSAGFSVTVTNGGPGPASAVQLQVQTSGLGAPGTWPAGCAATAGGAICGLGELAAGTAAPVLAFGFATGAPGSGQITATVSSATPDPLATNDSAQATVTVLAVADLRLEAALVASPATPVVGDRLTLGLTVTNLGPSTAGAARVSLHLPPGLALLPGVAGCTAAPVPLCELGDLAPGAAQARTLELDTRGAVAGSYDLSLEATSSTLDPPPTAGVTLRLSLASPATQGVPVPLAPAGLLVLAAALLIQASRRLRPRRR